MPNSETGVAPISGEAVTPPLLAELVEAMTEHGFRQHPRGLADVPGATLLMRRQTWNTNRALVVVEAASLPVNISAYFRNIRGKTAFACGFFPVFWGIGIQIVLVCPDPALHSLDLKQHVATIDNQWAIVQSIFAVDREAGSFRSARSWGQFVTVKFQDAIEAVLNRHCRPR